MTTFQLEDKDGYKKARLESWFRNHKKDYLTKEDDLNDLALRYEKHNKKAKLVATVMTAGITALFGYGIYTSPEQQNLQNIFACTSLCAVIWITFYFFANDPGKNRELFDSLRRFRREWESLQKLRDAGLAHRDYLEKQGSAIADATRRRDSVTEKKLMKKFREDHGILTNFGLCVGGYEHYIPKTQEQKEKESIQQLYGHRHF